jgi:glucokinase
MYVFLRGREPEYDSVIEKEIGEKFQNFEDSTKKSILLYGCQNKDTICRKVVDLFLDMLSTIVGDYICQTLPFGGLYIV